MTSGQPESTPGNTFTSVSLDCTSAPSARCGKKYFLTVVTLVAGNHVTMVRCDGVCVWLESQGWSQPVGFWFVRLAGI
jgi:hypothetical protein